MIRDILILIQFYTRIPIKKELDFDKERYAKSIFFLPIVSLLIAIPIYIVYFLGIKLALDKYLIGFLLLLTNISLTGGLHLDGLADSFDGLFSYKKKDKMLEIMKDSNIGTNGVIGLILILLGKCILYANLAITPIILSLPSARLNLVYQSYKLSYERKEGMGEALFKYVNRRDFIKTYLITLFIFSIDYRYILILIFNLFFGDRINRWVKKKIDGGTGDTLGMTIELSEVFFLIIAVILKRIY